MYELLPEQFGIASTLSLPLVQHPLLLLLLPCCPRDVPVTVAVSWAALLAPSLALFRALQSQDAQAVASLALSGSFPAELFHVSGK